MRTQAAPIPVEPPVMNTVFRILLTGYPLFPEGGEWEPSEKKITHFNILPEVREMLIENGFDITIYRDKNPDEVSWEHFQEGRKGTQKITTKKIYQDDVLIGEEQIGAVITKAALNKVVVIGGRKSHLK